MKFFPTDFSQESWTHHSCPCNVQGPVILGVDEAGRGPVLGPMVYALSYCPMDKQEQLNALGFNDSKVLNEEVRETLFDTIQSMDYIGWSVYSCSPQEISESMLRKSKYNLNALAWDITVGLIQGVLKMGVNVQEIYVDTVGPPASYQSYLSKIFPKIKITVAKKADSLYPIVSAASICAKVTRDAILKEWEFVESREFDRHFGSGYPSDPNTVKWLKKEIDPVFGYPQLIRFSWSTTDKLLVENGVKVVWPEEEEDEQQQGRDVMRKWAASSTRDMIYVNAGMMHMEDFIEKIN